MSWNTTVQMSVMSFSQLKVLMNPIISQAVDKIQIKLDAIEQDLPLYMPNAQGSLNGRKITVLHSGVSGTSSEINKQTTADKIQDLLDMRHAIHLLAQELRNTTRGFEKTLEVKINPTSQTIDRLDSIIDIWLPKHRETLAVQTKFERN